MVGGFIGAIDGGMIGHIVGGQIGGKSIAPSHSGCIRPSTHWQVQPAEASDMKASHTKATKEAILNIVAPQSDGEWGPSSRTL